MNVGLDYTEKELLTEDSIERAKTFAEENLDEVYQFIQDMVADDVESFTTTYLAKSTSYSEPTIAGFLSACSDEDRITAFIRIRCPTCSTDHGTYYYKSNIPDREKRCFSCQSTVSFQEKISWNVRYNFEDRPPKEKV